MSNSGWAPGCTWPNCVTTLLWKCLGATLVQLLNMCAPQCTPPKCTLTPWPPRASGAALGP